MTPSRSSAFIVLLAGVMLAFGGMAPASSQIVINTPVTTGTIDFAKRNDQQFKTGFRMGISIDPTGLDREQLKKTIDALPLTAPNGLPIKARDFSAKHGFIIGIDDAEIQPAINKVITKDGRTELIVNFRDREGRFVVPPDAGIGSFDLKGINVPRLITPFSESRERVYVDLLLDRSGSMHDVIGDVKRAAAQFMSLLPQDQARCRVTSFNNDARRHTRDYQPCVPAVHSVGRIQSGGGTNIYQTLIDTYGDGPGAHAMRLVVVVSDGLGLSWVSRDAVLAAKNAPTFVYWLGDYKEDRLKDIADTFIYGRDDVAALLGRTLGHVAGAVNNQVVITIGNTKVQANAGGQP